MLYELIIRLLIILKGTLYYKKRIQLLITFYNNNKYYNLKKLFNINYINKLLSVYINAINIDNKEKIVILYYFSYCKITIMIP